MVDSELITSELDLFRNHLQFSPGHSHLYSESEGILERLAAFRCEGGILNPNLASAMLFTVGALVRENSIGRRPWPGQWERYFERCTEIASGLLHAFALFPSYSTVVSAGYCNRFLDAFEHMDRHAREYAGHDTHWSRHFSHLASMMAKMFSLVADKDARIVEDYLEHPMDDVFTNLLTGYAKSGTPKAHGMLNEFLGDEEAWVRHLAFELIGTYFPDVPLSD